MAYATQDDIEKRYGSDALLIAADRDGDGNVDTDAVNDALDDATDEINTYIAARYNLPLATIPGILARLCVDIALYRLSDRADVATDERRQRYEDAVDLLRDISKGRADLGLQDPPATHAAQVVLDSETRAFTTTTLKGVL